MQAIWIEEKTTDKKEVSNRCKPYRLLDMTQFFGGFAKELCISRRTT